MKTHLRKFSRIFIGTLLLFSLGSSVLKGQTGETLNFDGGDHVSVPSFSFGNNWTAEVWVNPAGVGGGWYTVLAQDYWNTSGGFAIAIYGGSVFVNTPLPYDAYIYTGITANVWTHLAATYNNGVFAFYKNGALVGCDTAGFLNTNQTFILGARHDNAVPSTLVDYYYGNMDEVRIWNTTRSQCEIQQYMNCEIPTSATGLVANYHFNQGVTGALSVLNYLTGSLFNLNDATGNGNTGTLNGFGLSLNGSSNWTSPGAPAQGNTTPAAAPTGEIDVLGNGNSIVDGSSVPSATNHTDFNGALTRTFVIQNTGTQTLSVGLPVFTGTAASQFSITTLPSSPLAATSGSTSFVVTFIPTSPGIKTATLNIYNQDCSEAFYKFVVTANALAGAALNLDGVDDVIRAQDPVFGLGDFTIETWIKPSTSNTNGGFILSSRWMEGFQTGYWYTFGMGGDLGSGRTIGIELAECGNGPSNYQPVASTGTIASGVWSHVALVRSGSNYYFYLNGILGGQFSDFAPHNLNNGFNNIDIGGWSQSLSAGRLPASLDEMRIWKVARTQCEIQTYMNCEIASTPTTLVGNYHFNQGVASGNNPTITTLTDASSSLRTGTLNVVGSSTFALTGASSNWISPGAVVSGSTTANTPNVEIDVRGNGNSIIDGNTGTSPIDYTDFNGAMTRTFTIHNINPGVLAIGVPYLSGTNANQFSITTIPSTSLSGVSSTTIVVTFTPTSTGAKVATLNIPNSDCDEYLYDFKITATPPAAAALNFDGVSDYITTSTNAALAMTTQATVEGWFKTSVTAAQKHLFRLDNGSNQGFEASVGPSGNFSFSAYLGGWNPFTSTGPLVDDGSWHHFAVVASGNTATGYIDGVFVGMVTGTAPLNTGSSYLSIGRHISAGLHFPGDMDELRVWNVARTQCDIQAYMKCEIPTTATGLVANYHFNQGSPGLSNSTQSTLIDAAGVNTGTLNTFNLAGTSSNWVATGGVISGSTTPAPPTASILVSGNSNSITPGSTSPTTLNFTDFGTATTRTFVIQNTNTGTLNPSAPYFTGTNASEFSVTVLPSTSLLGLATTSFVVAFTPTATGVKSATLNIANNVCSLPLFSCAITATAPTAEALNFQGGGYITATGHTLNGQSFSIEFQAKRTSTTTMDFVYGQGSATTNDGLHIGFYEHSVGDYFTFDFWNAAISVLHTDFNWHHWACVYDASAPSGAKNLFIYRDGILESMGIYTGPYTGTGISYIGATPWGPGTDQFDGAIDELRIWSTARSQCEIETYMNSEIPSSAPGLISNYHFNQGSPGLNNTGITTLIDAAASPHNGTLTSFALTGTTSNWVSPSAVALGYSTAVAPTGSFVVTGNGNNVPVGVTTSTTNFTDFGTATTRTFVVNNPGTGPLYVNTGYVTGANASNFIVTAAPGSVIAGSSSANLVITFSPSALGTASAVLNIVSSDCTYPTYSFVVTATAVPAEALNFDGSSDFVSIAHTSSLNAFPITVETWVKTGYTASVATALVGKYVTSSLNGWLVYLSNGSVSAHYYKDASNYISAVTASNSITDNNWHHVALVVDANGGRIYIDGLLSSINQPWVGTAAAANTTQDVLIGSYDTYLPGSVDEVRIWNISRTQCEIRQYMNCEIPTTASGLVANYHFNQGVIGGSNATFTTLTDAAGTNTGVLNTFNLTGATSNWITPGGVISGSNTPAVLSQTLNVKGNGNNVPIGITTSTNNFTDFSTNASRIFAAENLSTGTLYLNNIYFTGAGASQFSVSSSPASSITGIGTSSFTILFTPTAVGTSSAIVNINSSDCSNPNYSFVITASASPASALALDGVGDYVEIPNSSANNFTTTNAFTVEFWAKTNSDVANGTFVNKGSGWGQEQYSFDFAATDFRFYVLNTNTVFTHIQIPRSSVITVADGWVHIAGTYDGNNITLYRNGIQIATATVPAVPLLSNNNPLSIGAQSQPSLNAHLNGEIDELRLWNVTRTQCQIMTYMNCEIPTTASGLTANYHFNQGIPSGTNTAVTTLTDAVGSANGTLTGMSLTGSTSNWVSPGPFANGYTTTSAPTGTLEVYGGGNFVPIGATTSTLNYTDFGTNTSRTFIVYSPSGAGPVFVNSISLSGANASNFSVTTAPSSFVAGGGSSPFVISFTPSAIGSQSAIVTVNSSDCTNPTYSFVITASTSPASALDFDKLVNNRIIIPSGPNLNNQSFTVEFWAKRTSTLSGYAVGSGTAINTNESLHIGFRPGNVFTFAFYSNDINYTTTATTDGNYHHWACVYDASATLTNRFIYLDGVLVLSDYSASGLSAAGPFVIGDVGYYANFPTPLTATLDELRVWTVPRTQCDILTYMNCEIPGSATGLAANYHFNQGIPGGSNASYTTVIDAAGSYTGTLNGFNLSGTISNWVSPGGVISGSTTPAVLNQTISLLGNGNAIPVGSATSTLNFTDFGSSTTRVYTIHNSGTGVLYINPTITISGAGAADFSVTTVPASSISGLGNTTFDVSFIPSSLGTKTAVVHVNSSDCSVPEYTYVISASPSSAAAISFDGTDDYIDLGSGNNIKPTAALSIEMWAYLSNWAVNNVLISNTNSNGYGIVAKNSLGNLEAVVRRNGSWATVSTPLSGISSGWHHIALTYDGRYTKLYLDGLQKATDDAGGNYPITYAANNTFLGAEGASGATPSPGWYLTGKMDEVRIWNVAHDQCEIQAEMNCEIPTTYTGLLANYHFNQGIASGANTVVTLSDATGNGNNGTLTNFSLTGNASNWITPGGVISGSSCVTYSASEIAVVGGTTSLSSGDVLPSTGKDTDYGNISTSGNVVHTFTIQNTGNGPLSVSSITMSGADASSYLVGSLIPSSPIAAGNFAVFNVTFAPSSSGTKTAMVNISNTDCDEALFTYMLTGSGASGQSFVFDGNDDYVNAGSILTPSYTKEAWIKIGASSNGNNLISSGTGTNGSAFWAPGIYSYQLSAGHDGLWNQVKDPTALSLNTWYHVAVTYDAASLTMSLYKNGVMVASVNTVQPYSGTSPLHLGAYAGTYVVNGSMDEIRIWNRALCASEIVNNMNCEIQTTAPGLLANYHFNQGIGYGSNTTQTMVTDFSGAGNTGTVVNAALSGTTSNWQFTTAVTSGSFCPAISVPEINLVGNGVSIADGKTISATSDHTDFGSVCINTVMVRTYTVQNTGAGPLSITNMSMSGTNASLFTIGSLSPSSPISPSNSAVFSVTFAPTSAGTKTAAIAIGNDDCTESVYDFVLTGTCNALPVVTATASGSVICNGATVTLNGGGADTYTWTGGTPTVTNAVAFTPSATLNYTVTGTNILTGCTSTNIAVQGITVNPSPTISATVSNSIICAGATTTVFPANAGTYTLLPGPLSGTSIAVSPTITTSYTLTGTSLSGCNSVNNIPITITVNALPTVTANTTNSAVCDGFTTSVYGTGADTYTWTGSVTNSVAFVPTTSQAYTVSGTFTLTGCVSTNIATQSIVVNALPSVTASAVNSVICLGTQATLSASGANNYTWMPGPVFGATVTVSPSALTIYTVTGTSTANCTNTNLAAQSVSVNALPTVTANISNSLVCEGSSITVNGSGADTYVWTGGVTDAVTFTASVNSTYSVTGTNTLTGCTSTNNAAVTLSVNSLPTITVNISNPAICIGNSLTLSAGGGTSYVWSGTVIDNVAFSPTVTADYTVTGTDANSCVNSSVVTVTVNSLPVLSIIATNSLNCEAQTNTLTVTGASTYTWSGGETTDNVVITPTANTSYTVSGVDSNGCVNQLIYTQSVTPCSDTLILNALILDETCKGKANGSIALSFTTVQQNYQTSYYWNGTGLCPNNDCDSLSNLKAGVYSVKVKITYTLNSILVRSDSTTQSFEIREGAEDCVLKVYSGITRNGDGVNDFMYIENIEQYPNNTVTIFTRWGEQVYTMKGYNNIDKTWPVEGELSKLNSNTYFYVLDPGDGGKVIKGWIELIKK